MRLDARIEQNGIHSVDKTKRRRTQMVIDLSSGGMILLLVGTYVFTGCLGFVLGCCLRMASKRPPEDKQ